MNCILLTGGLFQIYSNIKENYLSYEDLIEKLSISLLNNSPNVKKIFEKYMKMNIDSKTIEMINKEFIEELNENSEKKICNVFESQNNNFETIHLKTLYSFFDKFDKIYFNYDNLLFLLIDRNVFNLLNIEINKITLCLNIKEILNDKNINPHNFLVFDTNLEILYNYHLYGCFTVYLSHLVKMDLETNKQKEYIDKFNQSNLNILNEKGIFFDFSLTFMIQCINYINYIKNYDEELKNYEGITLSDKIRNKTGAYNVMLIFRFFFKKIEIKRAIFFLCTNTVLYTTYIGDNKKNCYYYLNKFYLSDKFKKPDAFITKLSSNICLTDYHQLIEDLTKIQNENPEILFCNNIKNVKIYLNRSLQINLIKNFISQLKSEKMKFPKTIEELYLDVDTYDKFNDAIIKNDFKYPLILKFSGDDIKYDHLIINIICEDGLKKFIDYFKEYTSKSDKSKIKIVIQQFVNHHGYVIKLYRIQKKSFFYYRPSIPDSKLGYMEKYQEYKKGFLQLTNAGLVSPQYRQFWENFIDRNNDYKNYVDENYLSEVANSWEQYCGDTLFGVDFILDVENGIYYFIDANGLPGYKELYSQMNELLSNHIVIWIKQKNKK